MLYIVSGNAVKQTNRTENDIMAKQTHHEEQWIAEQISDAHPFPLDMLRYDNCVPATEVDANEMARSVERYTPKGTRIALRRFVRHGGSEPQFGRWESFGWTITSAPRSY